MRSFRSLALGSVCIGLFGALFASGACVNQENERTLELAVGTRCTLNSDCTEPNVCVFGVCHAQCNTSADCEHGERCVKGDGAGGNICQLGSEATCGTTADCVGAQVCGVDGKCRDGCKASDECLVGQICATGTCADQSEVDTTTGKLPESPDHVGEGQPCVYNTDCPDQLTCVESTCAFECNGDKDCSPGTTCVEHRCVLPTVTPVDCTNNSDCGLGFLCASNECVAGCLSDLGCAIGSRCFGGQCAKPIFDAGGSPDAVAISGTNLLAIYANKVLRCPLSGCNPTNVEELFEPPYPYSGGSTLDFAMAAPATQPPAASHPGRRPWRFGADGVGPVVTKPMPLVSQRFEDPTYELFSDEGIVSTVIPAGSYDDFVGGCVDATCTNNVQFTTYGDSVAAAMRVNGGLPMFYRAYYPEGLEVSRCQIDLDVGGCSSQDYYYPDSQPGEYITGMAVKKGLTLDDDLVIIGWSNGVIDSFVVSQCSDGCSQSQLTQAVDGIGQPTEVGNLRVDGDRLYWLTAEDAGNGISFRVQRCTIASCTPETVYSGVAFDTPQMAVSEGKLVIRDDGNVWAVPITP